MKGIGGGGIQVEVDVRGGEDLGVRELAGGRRVDARDSCVRVRRTDEGEVERVRELEILDVLPGAHEEAAILDPKDASSDHAGHRR